MPNVTEEQQVPVQGQAVPQEINGGPPQEGQQEAPDPRIEREIEAYITGLSKMLHSQETSMKVVEMLKSGPPEQTIPQAALTINGQMEAAVTQKGKKPSLDVLLNAGVFIVGDLVEIGNAAGIFDLQGEEQVAPILQDTMQQYIQKGLEDGSIDPVELQQKVEPLMTPEHQALGLEAGTKTGVPAEAGQQTAMQSYGAKMERKGMMQGGN